MLPSGEIDLKYTHINNKLIMKYTNVCYSIGTEQSRKV